MGIIPVPLAFGLFIVAVVASRIIGERALRKLDTEAKGRLVEAFADYRLMGLLPLAALGGWYVWVASMEAVDLSLAVAIFLPGVFLFSLVMQWLVYRRLRTLDIDPEYLRAYLIGRVITLTALGLVILA